MLSKSISYATLIKCKKALPLLKISSVIELFYLSKSWGFYFSFLHFKYAITN